ncbi:MULTISPECIES: bifunctional 3,4-dihydroxy-2-butanone 4-phosphate synthase/GTP cyclohydrolase II [Sulfurospirillum]|uniref:3,4-dihydroxy-2-butanone 4-phosphate synthase n=5 Tax=Sulfurospirillum TaxID=57665 RepID=RIBB_SULMU|nr:MULTISPECIES: bifunctional 3,4-dihydroxy-2-butanone 4-phosphate synthase/GTP cyclohydrolase II [Sulfurospirillum]O68249.1 RecName: Full=3,4-dihydroxy-2-butanone 4-phosphate synthase; Short=DHBP synthase [Sulfurospirillum multivorans]AAC60785.1 3,4-dihydroxy-2-butanone-4-phosphate synthase [Sulfurospirillum multivorans]AHJ12788.1 3,4-dihydroxy-2-butanone 4-phosphate synthase [Sulfurospirillum multivorans DSM 12446]AOO65267.1 3,4-dihydroxy-2-butanone 4-phosphate synthase [Sulfurospirillum halo
MNAILSDQKTFQAIIRVNQAIEDIRQGKMVVMVDDEDRENEGDLVYAASFSTPQKVNFMASHAKGLICVAISKKIANRLQLEPMVKKNDSSYETAFTITVDARTAATGISAGERDMTIKILADGGSHESELVRPGHIFPLIAKEGGALVRIGHTEGSVDLCRLAGQGDSAVICEIMKEDGTMARRPDLDIFCAKHELNIVYISDIVEYRMMNESLIRVIAESTTQFLGKDARRYDFVDHNDNHHIAYAFGNIKNRSAVKFHSIMPDNELLADTKKYNSLIQAIHYLQKSGGVLIFMDNGTQDMSKIREYGIGAQIIKHLGIENIELLSDSKNKEFVGISGFGLSVIKSTNVNETVA